MKFEITSTSGFSKITRDCSLPEGTFWENINGQDVPTICFADLQALLAFSKREGQSLILSPVSEHNGLPTLTFYDG